MAVSFVNRIATSAATAGTNSSVGLFTLLTGDYLIAFAATRATGNQTPTYTITSGASVTWTSLGFLTSPATTSAGVGITTQVWYGVPSANTTTGVTTTTASVTYRALMVYQFRGVTSAPTVVRAIGTNTSGLIGPGAWTTQSGNTDDAILWFIGMDSSGNVSPTYSTNTTGGTWSTGFNNGTGTTGGSAIGIATQYKILTANGTQSAFYTNGSTPTRRWTTATLLLPGNIPSVATTGAGSIDLTASGTDDGTVGFDTTALGEITLIATAEPSTIFITYPTTGSGSIELTGAANAGLSYPVTASGSILLTATALVGLIYLITASGSINLTAIATVEEDLATTGAAQIDLLGTAISGLKYNATGAGQVLLEATAAATIISAGFVGWGIPL